MARVKIVPPNDPEEMAKSSEVSWLCRLFQENKMTLEEKQRVIRIACKEALIKMREAHGQM